MQAREAELSPALKTLVYAIVFPFIFTTLYLQ